MGTTAEVARRAALDRAPLRGPVRVVVVLVDFADKAMATERAPASRSCSSPPGRPARQRQGVLHRGLQRARHLDGEVVGPYRMP